MRWKGSYTVEAAFVIPIVLGVVFVLLYALFWVHDQCVLQANIQNGLIQYSDTGEELPTNEEWKRTLQQNLWMGNVTETAISVSYTHLDVYKRQGVYQGRYYPMHESRTCCF